MPVFWELVAPPLIYLVAVAIQFMPNANQLKKDSICQFNQYISLVSNLQFISLEEINYEVKCLFVALGEISVLAFFPN